MKNCHARNKSLQLNERVHDSSSGDDNNGVPSEENDHSRQPLLPINNNRKRYKFKHPNKYCSVNEIMQRTCPPPPPQPLPPPPSSSFECTNDDDNGVGLAKDTMRLKPSGTINAETFSFGWVKTDKRGRESRVRDRSPEISEPVVSQSAVGYKCGISLKKLLFERYKAEMASVEKDRERSDATIPPQVKKPKENN
ncbi:hypothetical protein EV2_006639 [Malus domestica]